MDAINTFYATYKDAATKHEYDLQDLGPIKRGGQHLISFSDGKGNWKHFDEADRPTTLKDYDGEFVFKISRLEPAYKVDGFLDYHYAAFVASNNPDPELFFKHLRYEIRPQVEHYPRKEYAELITLWLDKKSKQMIAQQLKEKYALLQRAYEAASEAFPSSPLSAKITIDSMAEEMNYEIATVKRIVNELCGDGYAEAPLGMAFFHITAAGRRYLQQLNKERDAAPGSVNFSVGDNSVVQYQHGSNNSTQSLQTGGASNEQLLALVREIREGMDLLTKHLTAEQAASLREDAAYLETQLSRPNPKTGVIQTVGKGIVEVIKAVPANVAANVITNYIPLITTWFHHL